MRIAILYPPIVKNGCYPTMGQNRQFKFTNTQESFPPPIVPGYAATLLKNDGHEVFWHDGIIGRSTIDEYNQVLFSFNPDVVMIETKTPMIYRHWAYIKELKENISSKVVLVGDHVTWNPEESMVKSQADFVVGFGDYDFGMRNICSYIQHGTKLMGGIWYRENGAIKNSGPSELVEDLDQLPFLDWAIIGRHYHEAYLYRPTGYLMSGRGCGGGPCGIGNCAFCIWQHTLWSLKARLRSPAHVVDEIAQMTEKYHFKEIFDDNESGGIYNQKWLADFHKEMRDHGLVGEVTLSSNSRADNLNDETCTLLKKTGFRLLKVGLESGSNETLRRISKRETIEQIETGVKNAKDHGLRVKLTTMTGFPWETLADVQKTYDITKKLMLYKAKFGDCLQSSVIVTYPGTPLYYEALKNNWFLIDPMDYDQYDMSNPMLKCDYDPMVWCERIWKIHKVPHFVFRSVMSVRSMADIKLGSIGLRSLQGHQKDQRAER
jgi:anaerobic magnesium-protoporphyrin IX monomethyl ester cyclase